MYVLNIHQQLNEKNQYMLSIENIRPINQVFLRNIYSVAVSSLLVKSPVLVRIKSD